MKPLRLNWSYLWPVYGTLNWHRPDCVKHLTWDWLVAREARDAVRVAILMSGGFND